MNWPEPAPFPYQFQLMFEATRRGADGESNFALDDISIPVTDCSGAPLVPPSTTSDATGWVTV